MTCPLVRLTASIEERYSLCTGPGTLLEVLEAMVVYVANSLGSNHVLIVSSTEWSARNELKGQKESPVLKQANRSSSHKYKGS